MAHIPADENMQMSLASLDLDAVPRGSAAVLPAGTAGNATLPNTCPDAVRSLAELLKVAHVWAVWSKVASQSCL